MKMLASWIFAALLSLVLSAAHAQGDTPPGVTDADGKTSPASVHTGYYMVTGVGAKAGGTEPRAFLAHVTKVGVGSFEGTLEVLRVDENGKLVRLKSAMTGAQDISFWSDSLEEKVFYDNTPTIMDLHDEPLKSIVPRLAGHAVRNGFYLSEKSLDSDLGPHRLGIGGLFVAASEDDYRQVINEYKDLAAYKEQVADDQNASVRQLEDHIKQYMRITGQWLSEAQSNDMDEIQSKASAAYSQEKSAMAGGANQHDKASLAAMQVDTYVLKFGELQQHMEDERRNQQALYDLDQYVEGSPCMSLTSQKLDYDVATACNELPPLIQAAQARWKEVRERLNQRTQAERITENHMDCLWNAARHLLQPAIGVAPYCEAQHLLPE